MGETLMAIIRRANYLNNVEIYRPMLVTMANILVTPRELAEHWHYRRNHLAALRGNGRSLPFVKFDSGGVRYRTSDIIEAELRGTGGPLTVERVCLALAVCEALTVEQRAILQVKVRKAFA